MKDLIELTPTESFLQNAGFTMTLKDVADEYNKQHSKLVKSFEQQINELTADRFETLDFWVATVDTQTGKGRIEKLKTYRMNLKTLVWFIAKFDANLRADIVNFAFSKLEETNKQAIEQAVKIAKKPKVYNGCYMSVRGCIGEAFDDIEEDILETDVWNALVWNGLARTRAKITIRREIPENLDGIVGKMNLNIPTYRPDIVRETYNKWLEAGSPTKTEYERLQEEFKQIADYYEVKIEEAKKLI